MASRWTNHGATLMANGSLDLLADTVKVMAVDATFAFNPDSDFVDDGSANDAASHEIAGAGYAGGFGGAGRKVLASKTITEDDANDRAYFDAADVSWTGLNAGTIGMLLLIKEITNDAASIVIAALDPADLVTNGGDVNAVWNAAGLLQLTT